MRSEEKYNAPENREQDTGKAALLANEDGSVVVLALIILMLLTMVGTSATNTSTLEIQVAGNERNHKQNFFRTEAAALQGAQFVQGADNHTEPPITDDETFLHTDPSNKFDVLANWQNLVDDDAAGPDFKNDYYLIVYTGVAPWSSMDMTAPTQVRAFAVYGQLDRPTKNEKMIIDTGFARRM